MTFKAKNIGDFGVCEWEHQIDGFKATWPGHYLTCGTWFSSALKILTSTDANVLTCTYVNMYRLIQLVQLLESSITNQINPLKKRLVVKFIINIYFKDMELSDWYLNATWSNTESPGKAQQVKKMFKMLLQMLPDLLSISSIFRLMKCTERNTVNNITLLERQTHRVKYSINRA